MGTSKTKHMISHQAHQGFSLVELIVVITLLATLSIVVAPRFTDKQGFSEYAMQKRLMNALRNVQLKSMYDTRPDYCHRMMFVTGLASGPQFGPTTDSYLNGQQATSCSTNIDNASDSYLLSEPGELVRESLGLSAFDNATSINFIEFDSYGRPSTLVGTCAQTCRINFIGESTFSVCVEPEGYIYAC